MWTGSTFSSESATSWGAGIGPTAHLTGGAVKWTGAADELEQDDNQGDHRPRLPEWFVGLNMDDTIWDLSVFTKNRQRLLDGEIADAFFDAVLAQARSRHLLSRRSMASITRWKRSRSFSTVMSQIGSTAISGLIDPDYFLDTL